MNNVGASKELSLRVSVGTLVRVVFKNPLDGNWMLALERKATLQSAENGQVCEVKSQPFGGAIRLHNLKALQDLIGDFAFDSEQSFGEQDFRIFIRPSAWQDVQQFCIQHFNQVDDAVLENDPVRELAEEFADALKINLQPAQYSHKWITTLVEDDPAATENIHAKGYPTVRMYRIFEAILRDSSLIVAMLRNSQNLSNVDLGELAWRNAQNGGKGRANAVLALPLKRLSDVYLSLPPEARNAPIQFENNRLDETVVALLEGVAVPKYRRL